MQVFILRNPTKSVKGMVARVGTEVTTNMFILTGVAEVGHNLWEWVRGHMTQADMGAAYVSPDNTEVSGFVAQYHGVLRGLDVEVDGILFRGNAGSNLASIEGAG